MGRTRNGIGMQWFRSAATAAMACLALAGSPAAQTFTEPGRFSAEPVFNGNGTTSLQFDHGGRLLLCEKQGRILIASPDGRGGYSAPVEFADLRPGVFATGESGLLGLALDPDYRDNRHIYLFHTTAADQRLVRIRARADFLAAEADTPVVILSGLPRTAVHHKAGDIHIHPLQPDYVFISLGDDAQETLTRNPDSYAGKILKVHKATGRGAPDNPFQAGDLSAIRSRVWAMGFRNPFRLVLHPANPDILYAAENGGPANSRPREDRVSWVRKGADCAWSNIAYAAGASSPWFAPADSKCKVLATDPPSTVGIALASRGPFAEGAGTGNGMLLVSNMGYPSSGGYATSGSIRRWRLTGADWDAAEPVAADGANRFVTGMHGTDLEFGPDGSLYASSTHGEAAIGGWYMVRRVRPTGIPTALGRGGEAIGKEGNPGNDGIRKATQAGRFQVSTRRNGLELEWADLRGRRIVLAP